MAKGIEIIIAGIIAGIVAYTTSILGIKGTVLGAVITSILIELLSNFFKEPFEKTSTRKNYVKITYLLPLFLIGLIEIIYLLIDSSFKSYKLFYLLEDMASGNLFRIMGLSLIVMGVYPIVQSKDIKRDYGLIIAILGIILLLRGFVDADYFLVSLYAPLFVEYDFIISLVIISGISYVIFKVLNEVFKTKTDEISKEDDKTNFKFNKSDKSKIKTKKQYKRKPRNYTKTKKSRKNDFRHNKPKITKAYNTSKPNEDNIPKLVGNEVSDKHVSEKTHLYYNAPDDFDLIDKE